MSLRRAALSACLLLGLAVPAAAAPRQLELLPGHAFRVAGTRVGCWVTASPVGAPSVECGLWGRTTRIIPGTLAARIGEDAVEVYQRPLEGDLSLRVRLLQPAPPQESPPPPPTDSARTTTLYAGDVAAMPGTDLSCAVVRRGGLGARCGRVDQATGTLVPVSALATITEQRALASRVNSRGLPSTIFYQRQPFVPAAATVDRQLRALARAARRLAAIRRAYHGTRAGYRKAFAAFRAIQADVRHDRFVAACIEFEPLLYNGFYLPRGSVREGPGHWYLHSVRKIEVALCG
jgi:hypothetical protein